MGGREIWNRNCAGLPSYLQLSADGCDIPLPEGTEGIIFSNIQSYGGGAQLWYKDDDQTPDHDHDHDHDHDTGGSEEDPIAKVDSRVSREGGDAGGGQAAKKLRKRRKRKNPVKTPSGDRTTLDGFNPNATSATGATPRTGRTDESSVQTQAQSWREDSIQDGCLEIVAVSGSLHLARIKVGLARATRLYQGGSRSGFEIKLKRRTPVQFDGEPFSQEPCTLAIKNSGKAMMLKRTAEGADTDVAVDVIEWAQRVGHISREQRSTLLLELSARLEHRERAKAADIYDVDEDSAEAQLRSRLSMPGLHYDVLSDEEPEREGTPSSPAKRRAVMATSPSAVSNGTDDWEPVLRAF
jgi:hypothetical protein